jgi:hypothetical protein
MKSSDRTILLGIALVAVAVAALFLFLGPKRKEAARLGEDVQTLKDSIAQQEQAASYGEEARRTFPSTYQRLVVLGKAVPAGDETSSMLVELSSISADAGVEFRGITLSASGAAPTAAAPPATTDATGSDTSGDAATTTAASAPVAATESVAANLPIGATIGPAGLPIMPYQLSFTGDFFRVADFISGLDDLVSSKGQRVVVDGRLMTIDGFALMADETKGFPTLDASFAMTAYATPSDEGLTLGASPSAPATSLSDTTTVSSTSTSTP